MEAKLASYQNFMAEYIVNAQNQKLLAVKEAELNAEKKFEGRLNKLLGASGMALPASEAAPAAAVVVESSFDKRNAQIIAAGAKSRWGSMEIERASEQAKSAPVAVAVTSAPSEVGATVFQQRNAQVAAAGAAGKSRWGNMEVDKAAAGGSVSTAPAAVAEKKEVTLEDRLNLGAGLSAPSEVGAAVFQQRNAQVAAAGAAGNSRWGGMEVDKAAAGGSVATAPAPAAVAEKKVVMLEDRLNLGARLLGA